jgi:L-lactate dehydrogenase complex protein LldG
VVVSTDSTLALWSTFTAKAELVGAAVVRAASQDTALTVLLESGASLVHTARLAHHFPTVAAGLGPTVPPGAPAAEVVSAGEFAVAETGSVAVNEAQPDRAACFLAERLWLLVAADQLVPNLDLALERIREMVLAGSHHPVLMTGPSRTADIERQVTLGAHGPRSLIIIVVGPP